MQEFLIFIQNLFRMLHFVRGVLLILLLILIAAAFAMAHAEDLSLFDALYLTFITALTVGYGDISPASGLGRVVSVFIGVVGVIYMGLIVAVSTRALKLAVEEQRLKQGEKQRIDQE